MRTNKKVWKLVSVVLALAMVAGLMPSGLIMKNTTVKASTTVSIDTSDFYATVAYQWEEKSSDVDSSVASFGTVSSSYGISSASSYNNTVWVNAQDWYTTEDSTMDYYATLDSSGAGTYTITAYIDAFWNVRASGTVTIYPYINGSADTSTSSTYSMTYNSNDESGSSASSISGYSVSGSCELDSSDETYTLGVRIVSSKAFKGEFDIAISIEYESSDDSGDTGDDDDTSTTKVSVIDWGDYTSNSNYIPGDFEIGNTGNTLQYSKDNSDIDFNSATMYKLNNATYVQLSSSYNHTSDNSGYSARLTWSGTSVDTNQLLYFTANTSATSGWSAVRFPASTVYSSGSFAITSDWTEYTLELGTLSELTGIDESSLSGTTTKVHLHFGVPRGSTTSTYTYNGETITYIKDTSMLGAYIGTVSELYEECEDETLYMSFAMKYDGSYVYIDDVDVYYLQGESAEGGNIISAAYDTAEDYYAEGCFENAGDGWKQYSSYTEVSSLSYDPYTNAFSNTVGESNYYGAHDGEYAWNAWGYSEGDTMYILYPVDGIEDGNYEYSYYAIGSNISVDIAYCTDYTDIEGTVGTLTSSSDTISASGWTEVTGSFTVSGQITGTHPAIGLKVTTTADSGAGWGWFDTFNISGPEFTGEKVTSTPVVIPTETETAISDSDFSESGWTFVQMSQTTVTATTDDDGNEVYYTFVGKYSYINGWWWDDSGSYTEYDTGYAYYEGQNYQLLRTDDNHDEGVYTMEATVAGENITVYPMIYDADNDETIVFYDYGTTVEDNDWDDPVAVAVTFALEKDYDNAYVGIYVDTSTSGCWVNITAFSWYYGSARVTIWDDQPENGDFEFGSIYPWIGENDNDTTDFNYGYTVNQSQSGADGYTLNVWNNVGPDEDTGETNTYTFTMYEYIRLNEDGTWYLDYESMGETYSEYFSMTANIYTYDEDEGEAADATGYSVTMQTSEAYSTWTEFVESEFGGDTTNVTLLENGAGIYSEGTTYDDDGNIETSGTIIMLEIVITLGQYDWVDLDNIKLVNDDYVSEGRTYIAVDCFENGGFEDTWALSQYWSGDGDVDEDYEYGYTVTSDWEDETNAVYSAWSNDQDEAHTFTLTQMIQVTSDGNYEITFDTRGWLYEDETKSTATLTVYMSIEN